MAYRLRQKDQKIDGVERYEAKEVLVVPMTEAVIDEWAVVIELFDALVADSAMEGGLRLDDLTEGTQVFQVHS